MSQPAPNTTTDSLLVDVQIELSDDEPEEPPSAASLTQWAQAAYAAVPRNVGENSTAELTIRVTSAEEMTMLNQSYRGKSGVTNVLSFPLDDSELPPEFGAVLLGDVVICHPVVVKEAQAQSQSLSSHYAHMVTHGVLHLCGYDHELEEPAQIMEALETAILQKQGFADPYA